MAEIWSPCTAKSQGEQRLARLLESICDGDFGLCFSIGSIPGVREIDLLINHRKYGVFIVEIKAVPLRAIISVSPREWEIANRGSTQSPLVQAYDQFEGLRNYWRARVRSKLPRVSVSACLPEISRSDWLRDFRNDAFALSIAEGLIFREDLVDASALSNRLEALAKAPAIRRGIENPTPAAPSFEFEFRKLLAPGARQSAGVVDRQKLIAIEKGIDAELRENFPVNASVSAIFSGHPGTGKTFRLLSIGAFHSYAKKSVLFACFNKTLATDVRRLISLSEKMNLSDSKIEVVDIFQLAIKCFDMNGLSGNYESPDAWGREVVRYLRENPSEVTMRQYDTVLVDEAHDMQDWQLELLTLHAKPNATLCIALGKGQELYRDDSSAVSWLDGLSKGRPILEKKLRRNFRNTKSQYFAALAFHNAWPDKYQEVQKAHAQVFKVKKSVSELEFDRPDGPLVYLPIPAIAGEFENNGEDQADLVAAEFSRILTEELKDLIDDGQSHPVGMLVLVPSETAVHTIWARRALTETMKAVEGVSFIDYTDEDARRTQALTNEIRLCTFHSSRGLEGERVIIFGLEQLEAFSTKTNVKAENLAFIALSRAVFRTVIAARSHYANDVHKLLKEISVVHDAVAN